MDQTILITGHQGLIGQSLTRAMVSRYRVVGLDRTSSASASHAGVHAFSCDLSRESSVESTLARIGRLGISRFASVIHLADDVRLERKATITEIDAQHQVIKRLLRGLAAFEVDQFIFASTMLVHAPSEQPGRRIDETARLAPAWYLPQVKLAVEEFLQDHARCPVVALRMAGIYDEGCHSLQLAQQIERIRKKRITSRHYAGNPEHGQPFLHVHDLVDAIVRAVERRSTLPRWTPLLLGEPETPTYNSLQRALGRLLHDREWKTQRVSKFLARSTFWLQYHIAEIDPFLQPWMIDVADHHYELDTARAEDLLGWKANHAIMENIPVMIRGLQADPELWEREHGFSPIASEGTDHAFGMKASAES